LQKRIDLGDPTTARLTKALSSLFEIPGTANRITPMEGMRGYAVLLVFLVHHHSLFGYLLPASGGLYDLSAHAHDIGHSGVDLFFVLSGFLIYGHLLQRAPSYLSYLGKRLHRIYPTFISVFCLYIAFSLVVPSVSRLPHPASRALLYVIENLLFLPGIFAIEPLITVTWSLSYEFFFYLSIPLLIHLTGLRQWRRSRRIALFLGLLLAHFLGSYFGVLPHIRLSLFLVGILLYEVTDSPWNKEQLSRFSELAAVGVYAVTLLSLTFFEFGRNGIRFHPHFPNRSFVYWAVSLSFGLFGLTLHAIAFKGILRRFFALTPLRWLGNMSYTYFLCHGIVLNAIAYGLRGVLAPQSLSSISFGLLLVLNVIATLVASTLLFAVVEKPLSLVGRRNRKATPNAGSVQPIPALSARVSPEFAGSED